MFGNSFNLSICILIGCAILAFQANSRALSSIYKARNLSVRRQTVSERNYTLWESSWHSDTVDGVTTITTATFGNIPVGGGISQASSALWSYTYSYLDAPIITPNVDINGPYGSTRGTEVPQTSKDTTSKGEYSTPVPSNDFSGPSSPPKNNGPSSTPSGYGSSRASSGNDPSLAPSGNDHSNASSGGGPSIAPGGNGPSRASSQDDPSRAPSGNDPSNAPSVNDPSIAPGGNGPSRASSDDDPSRASSGNDPSSAPSVNDPSSATSGNDPSRALSGDGPSGSTSVSSSPSGNDGLTTTTTTTNGLSGSPDSSDTSGSTTSAQPIRTVGDATNFTTQRGTGDIREWLDGHNLYRSRYGAPDLKWDSSLADQAQGVANSCRWRHIPNNPSGENIAAGQESAEDTVIAWVEGPQEKDSYDPASPQFSHFTQVVWESTTHVGCATVSCTNIEGASLPQSPVPFYVCEYAPKGNIYGSFGANVKAARGGQPLGSNTVYPNRSKSLGTSYYFPAPEA